MDSNNKKTKDEEIIHNFMNDIRIPIIPNVKVYSDKEKNDDSDVEKELKQPIDVTEMNSFFIKRYDIYEKVLAPELRLNENLKRQHKTKLMNNIFKILKIQFVFMYISITLLLIGIFVSNWLEISEDIIANIISFMKFYISSIVVELISILFFIVKNVFDKSIFDLFKNFDTKDADNKHEEN
uniref:Uncharacterized protein n=1 Tax=Siphoviridae sp. ctJLl6 TaxID=2827836 RepID=A0A8S5SBY0_9CAUD|nr:MAG TPA: hypothetical protein [Siphoviridae sp. ctJLl6]